MIPVGVGIVPVAITPLILERSVVPRGSPSLCLEISGFQGEVSYKYLGRSRASDTRHHFHPGMYRAVLRDKAILGSVLPEKY